MKKKLLLSVLFFAGMHAFSQPSSVNSGNEAPFYSAFDLTSGTGTWTTARSGSSGPGYYSAEPNAAGTSIGYFTNASDANNINGYVKKYGEGAFTFPVGTGTELRSLSISSPAVDNSAIATAWIAGDPTSTTDPTGPNDGFHAITSLGLGLTAVSPVGEWDWQDFTATGRNLTITVSIPDMSGFATSMDLRLVGWDGISWQDLSGSPTATGNTAGSLLSGKMTNVISAIAIGRAATVLDIALAQFDVTAQNCNANITWTTTHEDPSTTINIEQSTNGINFSKIAGLTAQYPDGGTYYYTASQNGGISYYYRLKIINLDGRYRYSSVLTLTTNCGNEGNYMKLYPNPVTGALQTNLHFRTSYKGSATLQVINVTGQQFLTQRTTFAEGDNIITINTSSLTAGIYYIKLADLNGNAIGSIQKLIKQ